MNKTTRIVFQGISTNEGTLKLRREKGRKESKRGKRTPIEEMRVLTNE